MSSNWAENETGAWDRAIGDLTLHVQAARVGYAWEIRNAEGVIRSGVSGSAGLARDQADALASSFVDTESAVSEESAWPISPKVLGSNPRPWTNEMELSCHAER